MGLSTATIKRLAAALRKAEPRHQKRLEFAGAIIDLYENALDKTDITIPDENREGAEEEARIYGNAYKYPPGKPTVLTVG